MLYILFFIQSLPNPVCILHLQRISKQTTCVSSAHQPHEDSWQWTALGSEVCTIKQDQRGLESSSRAHSRAQLNILLSPWFSLGVGPNPQHILSQLLSSSREFQSIGESPGELVKIVKMRVPGPPQMYSIRTSRGGSQGSALTNSLCFRCTSAGHTWRTTAPRHFGIIWGAYQNSSAQAAPQINLISKGGPGYRFTFKNLLY